MTAFSRLKGIVGWLLASPPGRSFASSAAVNTTTATAAAAGAGAPSSPPAIEKLLIANRGEIACRIMTTAKRLGIPTVAVFSEADRGSKHVALADEALCIGPPPAHLSYLRQERILEASAATGATAIHPGYGFLSENAKFAAACNEAGISFVGPPPAAIEAMGDKSRAKAVMSAAGVPVVPGFHGEDQSDATLLQEAARVGYPLLVKAVMGGGGKGMKLARSEGEFLEALHSARREAAASFGNDHVLLERFIETSRHVEVQVMVDTHGNAFYLAERDCSVQRRHQKVIEEAPAPGITPAIRAAIGSSAVDAARAVGYRNAGTVEFILDSTTGEYYFMEMNTRLQVEHPITEAVTGQDLVELQLRVAAGEALSHLRQENLEPRGHAFEARLYAENPANGFLPAGGTVLRWQPPPGASLFTFNQDNQDDSGVGKLNESSNGDKCEVRVDSGVRQGDVVGVNYDPMIAKVLARGPDRATALRALGDALGALQVAGLPTNAEFLRRITLNKEFQAGEVDTSFISRNEAELLAPMPADKATIALAAAAYLAISAAGAKKAAAVPVSSPWAIQDAFRVNHRHKEELEFSHGGSRAQVAVNIARDAVGSLSIFGEGVGGKPATVAALKLGDDWVSAEVDGRVLKAAWCMHTHGDEEVLDLWVGAQQHQFRRPIIRWWARTGAASSKAGTILSPMPGRIVKVFVSQGDAVEEGETLCVVEAMKMEHAVRAPVSGVVEELHSFEGAQVQDGQKLAVVAVTVEEGMAAAAS